MPSYADEAREVRTKNILELGLGFSTMARVFERGSGEQILPALARFYDGLPLITCQDDYEREHAAFCHWFVATIRTAAKKASGTRPALPSRQASYGHAAKVLDIAVKVYVYYCAKPSEAQAAVLLPMLHSALDGPMMDHLERRFLDQRVGPMTIQQVDEDLYKSLQRLVAMEISEDFRSEILPVQYDDIMWRRLNRTDYRVADAQHDDQ